MADQQADDTVDTADTEVSRIEALDERFGRIESEQAEHRSMLEQIRDAVAGKGAAGPAHEAAEKHTEGRLAHPPAESIAEQVRRAVADVGAEEERKRQAAAHEADHQKIREAAERPPRETASGVRGRIQRAMFGSQP